jgi:hypothetical protein
VTFTPGNATRVLVNEKHVSATVSGWSASHQRAYGQVDTILDTGTRWVPGLMSGSIALRGPQDSVDQGLDAEIRSAVGTDNVFLATLCPYGTAIGMFAMTALCDISAHTVDASVSEAVGFTATATPDTSVDMGFLAHALTAETADGNGTSIDRGAGSTNGAVAALHVTAYSGLTSAAIKIQHSTDNSSWSDLTSFTTATAVGWEHKVVAAGTTVSRYVRTVTDVTGTGSVTFLVAFAPR